MLVIKVQLDNVQLIHVNLNTLNNFNIYIF